MTASCTCDTPLVAGGRINQIRDSSTLDHCRGRSGHICVPVFADWSKWPVEARCIIIMQAAKTGLTGGSSPSGEDYDRDVIIINISRIRKITLLAGGDQVLAFPGTTLFELTQELKKIDRVPHSVLGSTSIGATVIGGIANNAGGALCKRGSSYTELALYARVDEEGRLELVDHLGIRNLGDTPEEILTRLERGDFAEEDQTFSPLITLAIAK